MPAGRIRTDSEALAGVVGGYAPLDTQLYVGAAYNPSGTVFPAQPGFGNNRLFVRLDLRMAFFYNGAQWLPIASSAQFIFLSVAYR